MKWNVTLTGFAALILLPMRRCRFVTGSTVIPSSMRWNCLQYAATKIAVRCALEIVPPSNVSSVHWPSLSTAHAFTSNGGSLQDKHWRLLRRVANYTCAHWHLPESGIWELSVEAHYVAGKVMSWVVLERVAQISRLTGFGEGEELAR